MAEKADAVLAWPTITGVNRNILSQAEMLELVCTTRAGGKRTLALLPNIDSMSLDSKLINSKAFRNAKLGCKRQKESYFRSVLVKLNIKITLTLFPLKGRVHISMETVQCLISVMNLCVFHLALNVCNKAIPSNTVLRYPFVNGSSCIHSSNSIHRGVFLIASDIFGIQK